MNKLAGFVGLAITVLSLIVGAAMSWQKLNDRVDQLEKRDHYEHGSYALPGESTR